MPEHSADNDAPVPWEAFDVTHPDHEWWVGRTGRCLAGDGCEAHRVTPPGETEEETAEWYDTHDAITGAVIPPGQTAPDGKVR